MMNKDTRRKIEIYILVSDKRIEEKDEQIFSSSDKQCTSLKLLAPPSILHPKYRQKKKEFFFCLLTVIDDCLRYCAE